MKVCSKFCALLEVVEVASFLGLFSDMSGLVLVLWKQGNIHIVDIMKKTRSFFLHHTKHDAGIMDICDMVIFVIASLFFLSFLRKHLNNFW